HNGACQNALEPRTGVQFLVGDFEVRVLDVQKLLYVGTGPAEDFAVVVLVFPRRGKVDVGLWLLWLGCRQSRVQPHKVKRERNHSLFISCWGQAAVP
ncbi:MAG: hypothetical protein VX446_01510, partial [Bacteroidota bacterium]|nr:hypothetical protein [Bacteroidota bacterium]